MKAISLQQPEKFKIIDIPNPEDPKPDEALVKVHNVGICGTDISGYYGKMPLMSYPRILGHELGVEVISIGQNVTNVKVGDRCSIEPYINCINQCIACNRNAPNCCSSLKVLGVHTDGGMRPKFLMPARKLHSSSTLTFEQLALVETLGIGSHAADRGAPTEVDTALIIGAGPIGLATFEFVRLTGAKTIFMDLNRERLSFTKDIMHCDHTIVAEGNIVEKIASITNGDLANVVFDATGSNKSMSEAVNYVAPSGTLVYVGLTAKEVSFQHIAIHRPELTIKASRNSLPENFARIISLIEEGKIDTRPWITHRSNFDSIIENFPSYADLNSGVIKAILSMT